MSFSARLISTGLPAPSMVQVERKIRHDPHDGNPAHLLERGQTRAQDFHIAAELVHHKPPQKRAILGCKERDRAVELGKHPAWVDVAREQHGGGHGAREPHVDDVVFGKVDFDGAAGALDDDDVVFLRERIERLQNLRHERLLSREVVPRSEGSLRLAGHDELASVVAFGLEQDGAHAHAGRDTARLGLHDLGAPHLEPVGRDTAVERHVLALEGSHAQAVLRKHAAQPRRKQALPRVRHGALDHDGLRPTHGYRPPSPNLGHPRPP